MKKLFTILAAATLLSAASQAQTLSVYAYGEQIQNGATIHLKGEIENLGDASFPITQCKWDPELIVKPSESIPGIVECSSATPMSASPSSSWAICWPMNCINFGGDTKASANGTFDAAGSALQIHYEVTTLNEPLVAPENNSASIVIKAGGETFTVTLVTDKPASVGELGASASKAVYYNLHGQKVLNPEKGMFIKVQDGKSSKVMLR